MPYLYLFFIFVSFGFCLESQEATVPLMNQIYHPVSTANPEAQKSFDRGLTSIYAFNHDEAYREFENAAKADPNLAMAYWGMALALGQNINRDVTPENEVKAYQLIQKALKLTPYTTPYEEHYIKALATRYVNDPEADFIPLRYKYAAAMRQLKDLYPEDLDAATLYAESLLDIDPWIYWSKSGKPSKEVLEAIDVLESVLKRAPEHIGANHYAIHAYEESPFPERALMNAHRLDFLLPATGHLRHMPSHIYILVGDYEKTVAAGKKAIQADREYIHKFGTSGYYPHHYLSHNYVILTRAYMLLENFQNALKTVEELEAFLGNHITDEHLAHFALARMEVYLYFHRWKDILEMKEPVSELPFVRAYWHFARSMALAETGEIDLAKKEKDSMQDQVAKLPSDLVMRNNKASKIFDLATLILNASFAKALDNPNERLNYLKQATKLEDTLTYDEPPVWYTPTRQLLATALLQEKHYEQAENEYKKVLSHLARNGRSLFGLYLSLLDQGRSVDAFWVEREMQDALKESDISLTINSL